MIGLRLLLSELWLLLLILRKLLRLLCFQYKHGFHSLELR